MKHYDVTIKATVQKTIRVDAISEDEASEKAHQQFSVLNDDTAEDYEQDTVSIKEVAPGSESQQEE